ncbi:sugar phosphate isomerase/epimerase family protein [Larkinella soli]|uniref:sugar phosphate isomerase/epimerase family protein n=1 Tax=Larkinella soli TaxID=1770527 RepID=UPI000FFBF101|nr:TIM barrel protein [Larkinella soli]
MERRDFLQRAALGAAALAFPKVPGFLKDVPMGVVVHSYASRWNSKVQSRNYPAFTNALDLLEHCRQIGAGGVQVVVKDWTADFARQVRERREKLGLYLEGSIGLPKKPEDVAVFEKEVVNAREAGAQILRTVTLGGRRYETFKTRDEFENFRKTSLASLQMAEPVLKKHKMRLAVENHKDYTSKELVTVLKQIGSEWVGATIDFGNNLALLEDPMEVVERLAPFVQSVHIKDMAVDEYPDGFLLSEVPLGSGILDLPKMIALCRKANPAVTFNLEMITRDPLEIPCLKNEYWATFDHTPGAELARMLRTVRQQKYKAGLPRVSGLSAEDRLAAEEKNIVSSISYSKERLGLT